MLQRLHIPRSFSVLFWIFLLVIGVVTGLIAYTTSLIVSLILKTLAEKVSFVADDPELEAWRVAVYILVNLTFALLSTTLVLYMSPVAAGSGIPNMFAYLNGIEMPNFLNIRVALAKVPGSIFAVAGGLCIGKEGPMLHIGSIVATWLGNTQLFTVLRSSREQEPLSNENYNRELVTCGVAAGLAAGFSAPIGGLLFALEMSTRWRSELTARTLFACAVVSLTVQAMKDAGSSKLFNYGSLLFFKNAVKFPSPYAQIPFMAVLGILGGFVGCMYTTLNISLGFKRRSYLHNKKLRYLEIGAIALLTSVLRLVLPFLGDCRDCICDPDSLDAAKGCECAPGAPELQEFDSFGCKGKSFNDLAVFMFNPQGYVIKSLFATPTDGMSGVSLLVLFLFYYGLAIVTYGAAIPAGLFTPSLITGGALGRLFAFVVNQVIKGMGIDYSLEEGFYALLGAAAFLGGLFRFSVSFSVILAELTGAEKQLPFLMLVLIVSKGMGDRINNGILQHLCILLRLPYIGGHPESAIRRQGLKATDIMDSDYPTLLSKESPDRLKEFLHDAKYKAFPVMEVPDTQGGKPTYLGMITESYIRDALAAQEFKDGGTSGSTEHSVDLTPFVTYPVVISPTTTLTTVHRVFTRSGLEYIPVMEQYGPLSGVITRHQLLAYQNKIETKSPLEKVVNPNETTLLLDESIGTD